MKAVNDFTRTITLEWPSPPLTANQRMHWRKKADITRTVRNTAALHARRIPNLGRCDITLTWVVTDRRRRDADNLVPTLKALCDGLVDAGVVADDTPNLMTKHMPVIRYQPDSHPHLELTIRKLGPFCDCPLDHPIENWTDE